MSDYCPHCDDFSIDASRARRKPVGNSRTSNTDIGKNPKKIVINVDDSDENADWIKKAREDEQETQCLKPNQD